MAPKGKTAVSKEKKAPVMTARKCTACGQTMRSDQISTVLTVSIADSGAAAKRFSHRHKTCPVK
jgi:hypothetical protein